MGRYAIFNGLVYGGGTDVIPNPEGTPTDELHSIQIGDDIYEIVGGGGSGGGYKLEKIFDGNVTTTGNITLNKSISNYDKLLFVLNFTRELSESYITTFNVDVSIFKNIGNYTAARGVLLNDWSKDSRFAQVKYVDDTTIDVDAIQVVSIVEIYGVKLEGSGGGGSQELISYDTTITTTQYGWWTAEDKDGNILDPDQYELIAVTPLVNNSSSWVGAWDGAFYVNSADDTTHRYDVTFVNINDGGYIRTSRTWDIKVIYRDKNAAGGGGGSTVVPNPQEEPTDTLNTVEIDGVVYDIEGGSEGEGVEIYSESEYIVGKWIDGKKLYQKSIKFSATSLSTNWMTIEQGVDYNLAFPEVQGLYYTSNGEPFTQSTRVFVQNGDLKIRPLNELDLLSSTLKHVITIRYTKTVETPAPAWGGSVNNYYANFIDTDNVIDSGVYNSTTPLSYTASEDCFVVIALIASNNPCIVSVDNKEIYRLYDNGVGSITVPVPIKKGQTITATTSYSAKDSPYTVYGITYASGGSSSGSSVDYSTEEKEVGTWIDGNKLYQKTFTLSNITIGSSWNFRVLGTSGINIKTVDGYHDLIIKNTSDHQIVPANFYDTAIYNAKMLIDNSGEDLSIQINANSHDFNESYITIHYTKTVS